ncbi:unnamed protein product [Owenia fusiformis]|uniref:Uncharacterized protein n=1 Tax=Owenia fusiformis TaxID=6347 RepID=A0A8J1Y3V6_OWEFU|nr:unnamed protein product [Owenia fusiformis]
MAESGVPVIEFHMMDKSRYFPLAALSGITIRTLLYPFTLVKTRIQLQKGKTVYKGTFDAFRKIYLHEGMKGLYRGYWVTQLQIVPQMAYISTYENVRTYLADNTPLTNNKIRSFIAGGSASCVGQTFIVPIDIVSQYLMMLGKGKGVHKSKVSHLIPLNIPHGATESRFGAFFAITRAIYMRDGLLGFYKGYLASLAVYAPNSAAWWFFYDIYCGLLADVAPDNVPRLALQCIAAPMGGVSCAFLTNPLDIVRARIQVQRGSFLETTRTLIQEEQIGVFTKGLSARIIQSVTFSFCIILGYESIKRLSLLDEYKDTVRW